MRASAACRAGRLAWTSVMTATASSTAATISIDRCRFNRYRYIDACRSGARPKAEARGRRALLRARRLPRRRARARRPDGRRRQGARRSHPPAAGRRAAQACRQGLRVRARAAVRCFPAHPLTPPQEAARRRDRRLRAPGPVGLLLRPARRPRGAVRVADLDPERLRETVRERYAAAASAEGGCCATDVTLNDERGPQVFGDALYEASE